ncbi:MAG: short-chain dehydrogenase/reductase [Alphaproteobacteria bacterium]
MDLKLKGKRAVVTGASKGIGRAIAEELAAEGVNVDIVARSGDLLSQMAEQLSGRHRIEVRPFVIDLSDGAGQAALVAAVGTPDIFINNAGESPPGEIDSFTDASWREAWELKIFGYINLTRAMFAAMKARGEGVIVNIIGTASEKMYPRYISGSTGNSALAAMTRSLGARAPDFGLRVLGVNPGFTATEQAIAFLKRMSRSTYGTEGRWQDLVTEMRLPFGRMQEPAEVARLVAFLSSPRAGYISGTVVTSDGGSIHRN